MIKLLPTNEERLIIKHYPTKIWSEKRNTEL